MEKFDANLAMKKLVKPKIEFSMDDFISGLIWIPLSASEMYLVASSSSGAVTVYDVVKNKQIWSIENAHKGDVLNLVRCGGQRFATTGQDGKIKVWDITKPNEALTTIDCGRHWIEQVVYSQELERLAAGVGNALRVYSMKQGEEGKLLKEFAARSSTISALRLNPRKNLLHSTSYGEIVLNDIETLEEIKKFQWKGSFIGIEYSLDGDLLACAMQESCVHLCSTKTGMQVNLEGFHTKPTAVSWDKTGSLLCVNSWKFAPVFWLEDPTVKMDQLNDDDDIDFIVDQLPVSQPDLVQAAQFSHHGARLAVGCKAGVVQVFEMKKDTKKKKLSKQLIASYIAPGADNSAVVTIQWTNKDDMIAVGFENGRVIVFGF
jgi:WD40 repeat protein